MQPVKAIVRNGRLVVDEVTDLPDGTQVVLAIVDEGDAEEMTALAESIRQLPRRSGSVSERHAVIAARVARVQASEVASLSVDDVERSIRDDLDL
jgi:hypothetical protein